MRNHILPSPRVAASLRKYNGTGILKGTDILGGATQRHVPWEVGQMVRHKLLGYRGVVSNNVRVCVCVCVCVRACMQMFRNNILGYRSVVSKSENVFSLEGFKKMVKKSM